MSMVFSDYFPFFSYVMEQQVLQNFWYFLSKNVYDN